MQINRLLVNISDSLFLIQSNEMHFCNKDSKDEKVLWREKCMYILNALGTVSYFNPTIEIVIDVCTRQPKDSY